MIKYIRIALKFIIPIIIILLFVFMVVFVNNENKKCKNEINNYNITINQQEEKINELLKENQDLILENSYLNTQIEEKDKEIKTLKTKNNKLETENKNLKKKVNNKTTTSTNTVKKSTGNKATYQAYAKDLVLNTYGWSESDYNALVKLWERESSWNPYAKNKSSGAYGIPQALPASKMASEGSDYLTNYKTQIKWGLKYIKNRYGTPTAALNHSNQKGWY